MPSTVESSEIALRRAASNVSRTKRAGRIDVRLALALMLDALWTETSPPRGQ